MEIFAKPHSVTNCGMLAAAAVMAILVPVFGWLSDRFSRSVVAIGGMICLATVYGLAFAAFIEDPTSHSFIRMQVLYAIPYAAFVGATCTLILERFPVSVRVTGSSAGYNIAAATFGGMTPFWLALADHSTNSAYAPVAYVFLTTGLGIAGAFMLVRRRRFSAMASGCRQL